jgi:hypothetical protein
VNSSLLFPMGNLSTFHIYDSTFYFLAAPNGTLKSFLMTPILHLILPKIQIESRFSRTISYSFKNGFKNVLQTTIQE